jgi:hypothetical protein
MKNNRKISLMLVLLVLTQIISGQDDLCYIKKSFSVKKGTLLRLSNKYGDVNIITVNDDSLVVCATIFIEQENTDLLQKSKKQIKISAEKIKDTVDISTSFDKKFFSEESRTGRKSFRIDYLIKIPTYLDLNIKDEFGNVSVEELSGKFNLRLSQGTLNVKRLTRGNLKPVSSIFVDHSKVIIEEVNWMTLTALNCPTVNIDKAQALEITSSISKIKIGEISSLVSFSKSDNYSIKSVNNFISESNYTSYEIGKVNGQLKSKTTFGSVTVSDINKSFSSIDLVSGQSLISLKAGNDVSFISDIIATDTTVEFPLEKYPGIIRTDNNHTTALLGLSGPDKATKSLIKIRATGGKISIQ